MNEALLKGVWIAWIPVVASLFRLIGPARAVLVAVILAACLFLPGHQLPIAPPSIPLPIDKWIT